MTELNDRKILRPIFYAILIVLGQIVALDQLASDKDQNFVVVSIVVSAVLLLEIYTSMAFFVNQDNQFKLTVVDKYSLLIHWSHHVVLPLLAYYSGTLFSYFNRTSNVLGILHMVNLFVFTLLFFNLRSYFEHNVTDEKVTHYIYDILKMYIFFTASNVIYNAAIADFRIILAPLATVALTMTFTILSTGRRDYLKHPIHVLIMLISVAIGIISLLVVAISGFDALEYSFIMLLAYYFISATLHHHLDKSLQIGIVLEYLLVMALVTTIFLSNT